MPTVTPAVHLVEAIAVILEPLKTSIGARNLGRQLTASERHQLTSFRHELVLAHPALCGIFQQVRRNVGHILAQQAQRVGVGLQISGSRRTVAQSKFPDNPANRRRNRTLLGLLALLRRTCG